MAEKPDYRVQAWPAFSREVEGTLSIHSQYVLYGNIRDQFAVPSQTGEGVCRLYGIVQVLWERLSLSGFQCLITYDSVHGIGVFPPTEAAHDAAKQLLGGGVIDTLPPIEDLRIHLAAIAGAQPPAHVRASQGRGERRPRPRAALVVDYASRILRSPTSIDAGERDFFLFCQKAAESATPTLGGPPHRPTALFNPVIWLAESERDLPAWFVAGNERIRSVSIPHPSLEERSQAACYLGQERFRATLPPEAGADHPVNQQIKAFANRTDGLTLRAMQEITLLAKDRSIGFGNIDDAVRIYKLGVEENPWRRASVREQIRAGETVIRKQVLGQARAISKTLDILKRAALGLSGAQAPSTASRPRGVLFFAGPTGVGKTELAKNVAKLLFGDAQAYLRFDMSEFAADHAADRLTGAPPGYVGFEAGGELTGAVRRKPFQVVLFDEIEKANPLVMDKFLQILEDGRLTDGQGVTTYFSECVLIFTSNLGIVEFDEKTKTRRLIADPEDGFEELERKVLDAIRHHFTKVMGRPELLNRFGDNIVIFNFIDSTTAEEIFSLQLSNIKHRLETEHGIALTLADGARKEIMGRCTTDPLNGGRGIGNALETNLINPLARDLFDNDRPGDIAIHVVGVTDHEDRGVALTLEVGPRARAA